MNVLISYNLLLVLCIPLLFFVKKHPKLFWIICISFILRFITIHFNLYFFNLDESLGDSIRFEALGWIIADNTFNTNSDAQFCECINDFNGNHFVVPKNLQFPQFSLTSAYFISYFISIIYFLFGRIPLFISFLSLFSGIVSIIFFYFVMKLVWGEKISNKATWIFVLFPSHILYSSVILRESFALMFFLVSLYIFLRGYKNNNYFLLLFSLFLIFISFLFHQSFIACLFIYLVFVIYKMYASIFSRFGIEKLIFIPFIFIFLYFIYFSFFDNVMLAKVPNIKEIFSSQFWIQHNLSKGFGNAKFPDFFNNNNVFIFLPIKIIYFLFSPFLWDISSPKHIIGIVDSFLYFYLFFNISKNSNVLFKNPLSKILVIILLPMIIFLTLSTSNFGTSIRHRLKNFAIIINIIFSKKII